MVKEARPLVCPVWEQGSDPERKGRNTSCPDYRTNVDGFPEIGVAQLAKVVQCKGVRHSNQGEDGKVELPGGLQPN